jgi:hypothetical protein
MYKRQIIIESNGELNKCAKLDFKFKFPSGKFGKFQKLKSTEIVELNLESILEYHSDLVDYAKFLRKIANHKKAVDYEITALRVLEYMKRRKREENEIKQPIIF